MKKILKGLSDENIPIEVTIEDSKITNVKESNHNNKEYIVPGFIDRHIHGGFGSDFMDADLKSINNILSKLPIQGTTSIFYTSITASDSDIKKAVEVLDEYLREPDIKNTQVLGYHIEGPYINESKKGAHNEKLFKPLNKKEIDKLLSWTKNISTITYAIENSSEDITKYLRKKNIEPSVGHSTASSTLTDHHIQSGLSHCTHVHNAMSGYGHRLDNMGIVNSAYYNDDVYAEIIVDGIHVDKNVVKTLYKSKPVNKIIAVTDAIRPAGLKDGKYISAGLNVYKKGNLIKTERGEIAGSSQTMIGNFNNLIEFTGCSIKEAVLMTSTNVAQSMNIKNKGLIKEGYDADIILLSNKNNSIYKVKETYIKGIKI